MTLNAKINHVFIETPTLVLTDLNSDFGTEHAVVRRIPLMFFVVTSARDIKSMAVS